MPGNLMLKSDRVEYPTQFFSFYSRPQILRQVSFCFRFSEKGSVTYVTFSNKVCKRYNNETTLFRFVVSHNLYYDTFKEKVIYSFIFIIVLYFRGELPASFPAPETEMFPDITEEDTSTQKTDNMTAIKIYEEI